MDVIYAVMHCIDSKILILSLRVTNRIRLGGDRPSIYWRKATVHRKEYCHHFACPCHPDWPAEVASGPVRCFVHSSTNCRRVVSIPAPCGPFLPEDAEDRTILINHKRTHSDAANNKLSFLLYTKTINIMRGSAPPMSDLHPTRELLLRRDARART